MSRASELRAPPSCMRRAAHAPRPDPLELPPLPHGASRFSQGGLDASAVKLPLKDRDAVLASVLAACGLKLECLRMAWEGFITPPKNYNTEL